MSWVRLDDRLPYHRKVRSLPPKLVKPCYALYVASIQFCQWAKNDGKIRSEDLHLILPTASKPTKREVDALVACGLWDEMVGGWEIHDYLEWNAPAVERSAKARDASNARWNAHRNASSNAPSNADRNAGGNALLSSPTPLPSTPTPLLSSEAPDDILSLRDGRGDGPETMAAILARAKVLRVAKGYDKP